MQVILGFQPNPIRVQGIVWYNLLGHTTRRNDFATAERHFCQFLENHTPSKPNFKIGCQKKLFSKANEAWFLARRIVSKDFLHELNKS